MTSCGPAVEQRASRFDPTSKRDSKRLRWLAPAVVCSALALLSPFLTLDTTGQLHLAVRWFLIAILVMAAWICSARFALAISLITLVIWSGLEHHPPAWMDWLPAHLVRLVVVMGLVIWLIRLKEKVTTAERLARIDSLTGLPNRQALIDALEAELGRARRFGRPFSIALLDCDGFKQINDSSGHLVGDDVLKKIGSSLRTQTRSFDCAGRWGGDEFLIVLSEVDRADAQTIAERLRAAMRHDVERDHPTVTCSLGVVTVEDPTLDWQECVRHADEAMYHAKRQGPDQTTFDVIDAGKLAAARLL